MPAWRARTWIWSSPERIVLGDPSRLGDRRLGRGDIGDRLHTLQDVRKRGFQLAFKETVLDPVYAPWLPLAGFIKIDMMQVDPHASCRP